MDGLGGPAGHWTSSWQARVDSTEQCEREGSCWTCATNGPGGQGAADSGDQPERRQVTMVSVTQVRAEGRGSVRDLDLHGWLTRRPTRGAGGKGKQRRGHNVCQACPSVCAWADTVAGGHVVNLLWMLHQHKTQQAWRRPDRVLSAPQARAVVRGCQQTPSLLPLHHPAHVTFSLAVTGWLPDFQKSHLPSRQAEDE